MRQNKRHLVVFRSHTLHNLTEPAANSPRVEDALSPNPLGWSAGGSASAAAASGQSAAALAAEASTRVRMSGIQMARQIVQVGCPD